MPRSSPRPRRLRRFFAAADRLYWALWRFGARRMALVALAVWLIADTLLIVGALQGRAPSSTLEPTMIDQIWFAPAAGLMAAVFWEHPIWAALIFLPYLLLALLLLFLLFALVVLGRGGDGPINLFERWFVVPLLSSFYRRRPPPEPIRPTPTPPPLSLPQPIAIDAIAFDHLQLATPSAPPLTGLPSAPNPTPATPSVPTPPPAPTPQTSERNPILRNGQAIALAKDHAPSAGGAPANCPGRALVDVYDEDGLVDCVFYVDKQGRPGGNCEIREQVPFHQLRH